MRQQSTRGSAKEPSGIRTATAAVALLAVLALVAGCETQVTAASGSPTPARTPTSAPPSHARSATPKPTPSRERPTTHSAPPPRSKPSPRPAPAVMATGARSEQVRELQARLRQLSLFDRNPTGFYGSITAAAVSSFQRDRGLPRSGRTDAATWRTLRGLTKQPSRAALRPPTSLPVTKPDPRCLHGRVLCVSKNSRTLSWMKNGRTVSSMDVRFGSQYTPTREGAFQVDFKSRHHVSTLYDTPMPYAMFFSGGQAVHYSADFAARGYNGASHGCVNVRDLGKISALFQQVRAGDKVVVY
ncbi:L,D-transpeptidase family protein [Streptomyces sp. H27-D2]|uniref:L,D-transpeptidase family protein n=1 Tax=Streptomyces sp. H27-D2 TaxID=3046304 RepID=UPI002DBDE9BC|nr:L,D-transpeptidase family protein [Streptomyces sp. H27-D2]MEC4015937.1 L,D-transpeptidase family protein [Streptomyces sp. H27-D2]